MIDVELAAFLQEGIAIQLGTRNDRLEPNGVRVVAVTVDGDGRHLVAYVPDAAVSQVLPDLESNGQAALVFARPPDERACQVKGTFTSARPASEAERAGVEAQWDRWRDRLASIGVARATLEPWITWPCTAIRVRVTAIFNQTPGPNAGAPLA
jgi:pyridoxamine 5'-phosphate oxidase-like protein